MRKNSGKEDEWDIFQKKRHSRVFGAVDEAGGVSKSRRVPPRSVPLRENTAKPQATDGTTQYSGNHSFFEIRLFT